MAHHDNLYLRPVGDLAQEPGHRPAVGDRDVRERLVQEHHLADPGREQHHDQLHDEAGHRDHTAAAGAERCGLDNRPVMLGPNHRLQRRLPARLAGHQVERQPLAEDDLQRVRCQGLELAAGRLLRLLADGSEQRGHPGVHHGLLAQPGYVRLGGLARLDYLQRTSGILVQLLPGLTD
jgi:hypothetical protein